MDIKGCEALVFKRSNPGLRVVWLTAMVLTAVAAAALLRWLTLPLVVADLVIGCYAFMLPERLMLIGPLRVFNSPSKESKWRVSDIEDLALWQTRFGRPVITFRTPQGPQSIKGPWHVDPVTVLSAILLSKGELDRG